MSQRLWDELDSVAEEIKSRFGTTDSAESVLPAHTPVRFNKQFNEFPVGTKAIVVDRMENFYALAVRGEYVEGVHVSFIEKIGGGL